MSKPRYISNGNISTNRFVKIDSTTGKNFSVIQASAAGDKVIGVSQDGSRLPQIEGLTADSYAAHADQNVRVYGPGEECLVTAGGSVTQGDWLVSDGSGQAVTVTASGTVTHAGFALEAASSGELFRMFVMPHVVKYS